MILKKTYYSISEVSKMLNIQEHTIRFWDSKIPDLSKRDNKGKTRFFNLKQIENETSEGDTIVIPGKVLGSGEINKKIRICALYFSENAKKKLAINKSQVIRLIEEIKKNPKAEGVKLIK